MSFSLHSDALRIPAAVAVLAAGLTASFGSARLTRPTHTRTVALPLPTVRSVSERHETLERLRAIRRLPALVRLTTVERSTWTVGTTATYDQTTTTAWTRPTQATHERRTTTTTSTTTVWEAG